MICRLICAGLAVFAGAASVGGQAPAPASPANPRGCLTEPGYEPEVLDNPGSRVTFQCAGTPLDLIEAAGRQTRIPIGVVLGRDAEALSGPVRSYNVVNARFRSALKAAIRGSGFKLKNDGGVFVIVARDLTPRQKKLLYHRYSQIKCAANSTLVGMGADLTMWMLAAEDKNRGSGWDILSSMNDERFTLPDMAGETTREIADRMVSLGSRGIWIFRAGPDHLSKESFGEVRMEPYRHYSNRPNVALMGESKRH